jgi:hypothetical protein
MSVGVVMRKATTPLLKGATGKKLLLINTAVAAVANSCASCCNTAFMRKAEVDKGIQVFSDPKLENLAGISKDAAFSAVKETALSRAAMSTMCLTIPASMILALGAIGVRPTGKAGKTLLEVACIGTALQIGLPASISIFPPLSIRKGTDLEKEYHQYDYIYFNKGL